LYGTKYRYVKWYHNSLRVLEKGIKRTNTGVFIRQEADLTQKDGVEYVVFVFSEDVLKRPDFPERRVLVDKFVRLPNLREGDVVKHVTCGSVLLEYEIVEQSGVTII
jgi:hypothetical protein